MIALVESDRVYLAYSVKNAAFFSSAFLNENEFYSPDNRLFWKVKGFKNCIMGGSVNMHCNDVLRYDDSIFKCRKINYDNMITKIKPKIIKILTENNGFNEEKGMTRNTYFIAQDNHAFCVDDRECFEIEDIYCYGYYEGGILKSALLRYKDLPIYERFYKAVTLIEKVGCKAYLPMVVTDTVSNKVVVILKDGSVKKL